MKLTINDIGYMLVGIAKPCKNDHRIFAGGHWGKNLEYWLHVYVSPERILYENNTTYYTKLYCQYTLSKLDNMGNPIKEVRKTITSKEEFESFIMEVRSIKELYPV